MGIDLSDLNDKQRQMMSAADRRALGRSAMTTAEATTEALWRLEGAIEDDVVNYLTLRGVRRVIRQRRDKRTRTKKGTPDLIFSYRGLPCAWEVKRPGEDLREDQEKRRAEMLADGWHHETVRGVKVAQQILHGLDAIADSIREIFPQ